MSTEPQKPAEHVHLDPIEFWYMYKTKILTYGGIVLAAALITLAVATANYVRTTNSETLYAQAQTAANFQAIVQKYPGTPAGGNAALRLGELLRRDGKYDESAAVLRTFAEKYPKHPLAPGAWTSLAVTYETQGKLNEALSAYETAIAKYPEAYTTPLAMMAQARINLQKGSKDEARRIYTDVTARYGQTIYGQEAQRELHFIQK